MISIKEFCDTHCIELPTARDGWALSDIYLEIYREYDHEPGHYDGVRDTWLYASEDLTQYFKKENL